MRNFYKHFLFGCVTAIAALAFTPSAAPALPADENISYRDIVIVFSSDSTAQERGEALSILPQAKLVWQEFSSALIRIPSHNADAGLTFLRGCSAVAAADYDAPVELSSVSHDAYTNTQWAFDNTGSYSYISSTRTSVFPSAADIDLNIPEAWTQFEKLAPYPREVVVAVLDTGVDINHPDLAQNIWINHSEIPGDGIDNDNNGFIDDINGWDFYHNDNTLCHYAADGIQPSADDNDTHGSHVAGIIAAVRDNDIGIAGIASCAQVRIMPLKIHGGTDGSGTVADAIRAIEYATAMGADICNISWGTTINNSALAHIIRESDMLFIAAAGNAGTDNDISPVYPANYNYDNVISVAYTDPFGLLTSKSNYGANSVDIAAPGIHIFSTGVGGYVSLSGSSMAVPHVSGVAALLYSFGERQYPASIKSILLQNSKPLPDTNQGKLAHNAMPDAAAALRAVSELQYDYIAPTLSFLPSFSQDKLLLTVTADDRGSSGVRTIRYASRIHDIGYFRRGTVGDSCTPGESLSFFTPGKYTFYVSDYAGNERAIIYQLNDDITAPEAFLSYKVSYDYATITIKVNATDLESGIKTIKYAAGEHDVSYFLSGTAGTDIVLKKSSASFTVNHSGVYTVYLCDYRGNKSVYTINAKIIPATYMTLQTTRKTMSVGKVLKLTANVLPKGSTDVLRYSSSNPEVCRVNSSGKVTAVSAGTAWITVRTASGILRTCRITVQ